MGGDASSVLGFQGQGDWRTAGTERAVLHACAANDRDAGWVMALLEAPGLPRLRVNLRSDRGDLRALGFENEDGTPMLTPTVDQHLRNQLATAFVRELNAASR
jgi:hypothetical protein